MTRAEIINLSDRLLLAAFGTPFAEDPFTVADSNAGLIDIAADEVCKKTDCFYDTQSANLVANQAVYCAPTIYKIKDQYVVGPDGQHWPLISRTPSQMSKLFGEWWRDWTSTDPPRFVVSEGTTKVRLAPIPSQDRAGAIYFEGFATTTSRVTGSTAHLWPNLTDECPLPEDGQMAVVYKLCILRCLPYAGKMPEVAAQMAVFERQYRSEKGDLEANSAKRYAQQRLGRFGRRGWAGVY